ncbi:MAG TPA: MFS transporter [Kofleriaceae bacterium]|nr:MFS transporter [Kofleriaceae bacterium]
MASEASESAAGRRGFLARLALDRPELRAWALYDWANSPFITIVITAVFPIFFFEVAATGLAPGDRTAALAWANSISLGAVALLSPVLGAIADHAPVKKRFLTGFMLLGVTATAGLALVAEGAWLWAALLFGLGQVGATGSFVFYDSLLPHIAREGEVDRVSTAGYALGYVGGGVVLGGVILLTMKPGWFGLADGWAGARAGFVLVAAWWVLFAMPLLRRVPEPALLARAGVRARGLGLVRSSFAGLRVTFRELRRYRQATLLLFAFLVYNDGVGTIIKMATIYGAEIGLDTGPMIVAILITQIVGIPCTFLFGQAADRVGTKRAIGVGLLVYCVVSVLGYFMTTAIHFYLLAGLVGVVQGGVQALSRSLFASMIPPARSSEMFGLFAVFEKFAGIFGPAVFAGIQMITDSSRSGILSVIGFFVVGGLLLWRVDVEEGRRAVREGAAPA